jgi:hypothetical protein
MGARAHHDTFGPGTFERWVDNRVYRVRLDSGETKMLVAQYAPIRVLDSNSPQHLHALSLDLRMTISCGGKELAG